MSILDHFDQNAPEPQLFSKRLWNRSTALTPAELATLNDLINFGFQATIAKIETLNLSREQRCEVFEMLPKMFGDQISSYIQSQCLRLAGYPS